VVVLASSPQDDLQLLEPRCPLVEPCNLAYSLACSFVLPRCSQTSGNAPGASLHTLFVDLGPPLHRPARLITLLDLRSFAPWPT